MNVLELFNQINTFVFDVDGVLTDGTLLVLPNAVMARKMNIKDGYAMQLAVKKGYNVVIISGGNSEEVKDRLEKLGINDVLMRVTDKASILLQYMKDNKLKKEQILFMGDDIPDLMGGADIFDEIAKFSRRPSYSGMSGDIKSPSQS